MEHRNYIMGAAPAGVCALELWLAAEKRSAKTAGEATLQDIAEFCRDMAIAEGFLSNLPCPLAYEPSLEKIATAVLERYLASKGDSSEIIHSLMGALECVIGDAQRVAMEDALDLVATAATADDLDQALDLLETLPPSVVSAVTWEIAEELLPVGHDAVFRSLAAENLQVLACDGLEVLAADLEGRRTLVLIQDYQAKKETITLKLPEAFQERCAEDQVDPELVLRGFIADLMELREEGYQTNGSDERKIANNYYARCGYPYYSKI